MVTAKNKIESIKNNTVKSRLLHLACVAVSLFYCPLAKPAVTKATKLCFVCFPTEETFHL